MQGRAAELQCRSSEYVCVHVFGFANAKLAFFNIFTKYFVRFLIFFFSYTICLVKTNCCNETYFLFIFFQEKCLVIVEVFIFILCQLGMSIDKYALLL